MVRANDYKIDDTVENLRTRYADSLDQLTDSLKQRPWSLFASGSLKSGKSHNKSEVDMKQNLIAISLVLTA